MTDTASRTGLGSATIFHLVIILLLAGFGFFGLKTATPVAASQTAALFAAPALVASILAEGTRRFNGKLVWQWVFSFIPLVVLLALIVIFLEGLSE